MALHRAWQPDLSTPHHLVPCPHLVLLLVLQEQKQKEMEELNRALAEMGIAAQADKGPKDSAATQPGDEGMDEEAIARREKKKKRAERLRQQLEAGQHANGEPAEKEETGTKAREGEENGAAEDGTQEPVQLVDPAEASVRP